MVEDNAEATAGILSWADLHGVDSHGISMIPGYDRLRRSGRANIKAQPRIIKETPVSALVDGDGGAILQSAGAGPSRACPQRGWAITASRRSAARIAMSCNR